MNDNITMLVRAIQQAVEAADAERVVVDVTHTRKGTQYRVRTDCVFTVAGEPVCIRPSVIMGSLDDDDPTETEKDN